MNANLTSNSARFSATLKEYIRLRSTVDPSDIVRAKSKSLSIELYRAAKAAGPTKEQIKQAVDARGWAVKRPQGGYPRRRGEARGSDGPRKRMAAAAVKRRARGIGRAASGFLPALNALNAKVPGAAASNFPNPQGSCQQTGLGTGRPAITITNSTPGIGALENKHHLAATAFEKVTQDTQTYLDRKARTTANQSKR